MTLTIWFDLDGTLLDVKKRFCAVYGTVCGRINLRPLTCDQYWQCRCDGVPTKEILSRTRSQSAYADFIELRSGLIESPVFLDCDTLRPEAHATLGELVEHGFRIHVLTGRDDKEKLMEQLVKLDIISFIDEVYLVSPFGGWGAKLEVLSRYSSRNDIVVGDTPTDIIAGNKAGLVTCALAEGMATSSRIVAANPSHFIKELGEIIGILSGAHRGATNEGPFFTKQK